MFQHLQVNDLVRLASAGGGFDLRAGHLTANDLVRIATAAKNGGANLTLRGVAHLPLNDLVRIASAGGGKVVFARREDT